MLTTGILALLMSVFTPLVNQLPDLSADWVSSVGADTFLEWVSLAGYMLPFDTFFSIFGVIFALQVFRIVVSFLKNLWGVLPIP